MFDFVKKPDNRPLLWILIVACIFRLALSTQTIVYQSDEVWQYLEPAYGWLTGRWIVTWEYRDGIRGWLVPVLLYPPQLLGHLLAPETQWHILLARMLVSLLSLGVVIAFYVMGARISRTHAIVSGIVGAVWVEIFFFGPRTSGDALALSAILPAICLIYRAQDRRSVSMAFFAGLLLAIAFVVRFQLAPALLVLGLYVIWNRAHVPLWPFVAGGVAGLVLSGMADVVGGDTPFVWMVRNFTANIMQGRSASFGVEPYHWYITEMVIIWGFASMAIVPLALVGARRFPLLVLVSLAVLLSHMAVPHKELRFVLVSIVLVIFLASIGSVDVVRWWTRDRARSQGMIVGGLAAFWFSLSVLVGVAGPFVDNWGKGRDNFDSLILAGKDPKLCGLAMANYPWFPMISHAFLNRDVPVLHLGGTGWERDAVRMAGAYNMAIVQGVSASEIPAQYKLRECLHPGKPFAEQNYCIFVRPGGCDRKPGAFDYNESLKRANR